jgi:putative PIN family toxin of toxin-antitoxin system
VIFVRALINPASICGRLVFQFADRYRLILSEPVLREIIDVLNRPELTRRFRRLNDLDLGAVLALLRRADMVTLPAVPAISRDPNDDKFLATARVAGARYIVTEDQDLLVLNPYEGIDIVTAAGFLSILEHEPGSLPPP